MNEDIEAELYEIEEPEVEIGEAMTDTIDTIVEGFELLARQIRAANGAGLFDHFIAYHMAELEGRNGGGGWLGGPFLVDALREMRDGRL